MVLGIHGAVNQTSFVLFDAQGQLLAQRLYAPLADLGSAPEILGGAEEMLADPAALQSTEPRLGIIDIDGRYGLMLHSPLVSGNQLLGVLAAVIDLAPLFEEFLGPVSAGRLDGVHVIDLDGTVLYSSDVASLGSDLLEHVDGGVDSAAALGIVRDPEGTANVTFIEGDGRSTRITSWDSVPDITPRMVVVLSAPDDVVAINLSELRLQYVVAGVILLATLLVLGFVLFRARQKGL